MFDNRQILKFNRIFWYSWFILILLDVITTYIGRNIPGKIERNTYLVHINPENNIFIHLIFILCFFLLVYVLTKKIRIWVIKKWEYEEESINIIAMCIPFAWSVYFLFYCVLNNLFLIYDFML